MLLLLLFQREKITYVKSNLLFLLFNITLPRVYLNIHQSVSMHLNFGGA